MIVQCPACASQYQITDEKIRGKTVRLRCKSCGDAWIASGPKRTLKGTPAPDSMVVTDDTHDAYRRSDLPPVSVATPPGFEAAVPFAQAHHSSDEAGEPEGETLTPTSNVAKRRRTAAKPARDLFAPKEITAASVRESTAPSSIGSRNDNSVLFSLASFRPAAPAPAAHDHSGIIDIKALVSASSPPPALGETQESPSRIPVPVHSEPPLGAFSREVSSTQSLPAMFRAKKVWFAGAGVAAAFVALIGIGVALTGSAPVANVDMKSRMAAGGHASKIEAPVAKADAGAAVVAEVAAPKSGSSKAKSAGAKSSGPAVSMTKIKSPNASVAPAPAAAPKPVKKSGTSCTDRCGANLACAIKCTQ